MRAYFDKLLTANSQQKQLPLIYPLLIALFSGAVFSFALAPYHFWCAAPGLRRTAQSLWQSRT